MKKVSILLTLFIFASFTRALCDPVKSIKGAEVQATPMKMDKNKVVMQKKTGPEKKPTGWMKKNQPKLRDVNFLRTLEEKKRSQWVESSDEVISSRDFLESVWGNKFSSPLQAREIKPSILDSGKSILKSYSDGNGSFEEGKILTTLKLLQSKEELFKKVFMGLRFSFDLTSRHVFLEMDVAPSTETRSGFMIRF